MSDHKVTMAQLAMMQTMRQSNRLAFSTWVERYGAQVALGIVFGLVATALTGTLLWRFMA